MWGGTQDELFTAALDDESAGRGLGQCFVGRLNGGLGHADLRVESGDDQCPVAFTVSTTRRSSQVLRDVLSIGLWVGEGRLKLLDHGAARFSATVSRIVGTPNALAALAGPHGVVGDRRRLMAVQVWERLVPDRRQDARLGRQLRGEAGHRWRTHGVSSTVRGFGRRR
ncbi:hypothetical protein AB0D91_46310 [Streptomyces canus]|uniref:hypothetical protein n=1 Tax=Streptomyces canus TaxID=58343 RepID=UPI0033C33C6A